MLMFVALCDAGFYPTIHRWFVDFLSVGLHYNNEVLFGLHFDVNVNAGRHLESG